MASYRAAVILFLHGSWVGPWYWHGYLHVAEERGFEAEALDFTERWREAASVEELVGDVRRAIDEADGEAVLVGHSFGGLVAQHAAAPGGAVALVLMAPVSTRGAVDVPIGCQLRLWRSLLPMLRGRSFPLRESDARSLFLGGLSSEEVDACLAQYTVGSGRAMREAMLRRPRFDAGAIRCPVLVVAGERDPFAPPRIERRLARRLGADYLEAPGAGHTLMLGPGWEETAARVFDWITAAAVPAAARTPP